VIFASVSPLSWFSYTRFYSLQVEAFTFGSVPLRTYLPDGDIDISMFFPLHGPADPLKDTWGTQLLKALEREAGRRDAPFRIRNCQIIQAEFKLVKFVVADVVVDVSFNALGGLCTVAFLEWADRTIGRNHLFKRSIVLVKAWCYYESRLLGAHHGLISSYALEAMVLYVFNLHGAELKSPLQVLHRFLKELGAFEWEKYSLSLLGPIELESLPHPRLAKAAMPKGPSLIDPQELREAVQKYSVQPKLAAAAIDALLGSLKEEEELEEDNKLKDDTADTDIEKKKVDELITIALPRKYLNIMDPLLPTNNLGRSVSKTSYSRIRKALAFGARQLDEILKLEPLAASEGIAAYFENTWRSPTRMAADNQVFQNRLAMGGGAALMQGAGGGGGGSGGSGAQHRRRSSHGGGGSFGVGAAGSHGSNLPRSFSRKLSTSSLPDIAASDKSASSAGEQRGAEEGGSSGGGGGKPPLPPPSAAPAPSDTNGSGQVHVSVTPPLSPRSGTGSIGRASNHSVATTTSTATVSTVGGGGGSHYHGVTTHHHTAWAMNGHATTSSGTGFVAMVPVVAGDGRRAFHASLPTSPVLTGAAQMVTLQPMQMHHSQPPHQQQHQHVSVSASRDIFMADLDAVMANLDLAREWQQPRQNSNTGSTIGGTIGTASTGGVGSVGGGGNSARVVEKGEENIQKQEKFTGTGGKKEQRQQQQQQPNDALEAAMAALPHLRVSAPVADSYATVTAQGLTPVTVPNSQAASGAVSAAASAGSSAANTPRAATGPASSTASIAGTTAPTTKKGTSEPQQSQPQQQQSVQQSGRPPLPSRSAPGSGTSTPTTQSAGVGADKAVPAMPRRPWGRGAGGISTTAAAPGGANSPKGAAGTPTAAGASAGWSAVTSRQPSRLGQMHSNSTGTAPAAANKPEAAAASAVVEKAAPAPIVVVAEDPVEWPAFTPKDISTTSTRNTATKSKIPAPVGVWGSLPPSIKSGASTPAGNSPRAGSWAAAAASPKKANLVVASSPKKSAATATTGGNRRRNKKNTASSSSSPTAAEAVVVAATAAKEKKKKKEEQEFSLRTDEFPTL
jgi:hypothetical protein